MDNMCFFFKSVINIMNIKTTTTTKQTNARFFATILIQKLDSVERIHIFHLIVHTFDTITHRYRGCVVC